MANYFTVLIVGVRSKEIQPYHDTSTGYWRHGLEYWPARLKPFPVRCRILDLEDRAAPPFRRGILHKSSAQV